MGRIFVDYGACGQTIECDWMVASNAMTTSTMLPYSLSWLLKLSTRTYVAWVESMVKNHWKMELLAFGDFWNEKPQRTQALVMLDKSEEQEKYVVAFRGYHGVGKIHAGFMKALGLQKSVVGWPKQIPRDDDRRESPPPPSRLCVCEYWADGRMEDEPNKNYYSLMAMIPMRMNAAWEIVRSFIIGSEHGWEYQEGWLLRIFRIGGLLVPGLPNILLQDYVNATRLGTLLS